MDALTCIVQYILRNMHTVFALLCFVVVIHWLVFPYPSGLVHWHCGNLTIAPVPAKQPWWIWINTSCEFIMNDCITTTKQSTTKPCVYFLGYTVSTYMKLPHTAVRFCFFIWRLSLTWVKCNYISLFSIQLVLTLYNNIAKTTSGDGKHIHFLILCLIIPHLSFSFPLRTYTGSESGY